MEEKYLSARPKEHRHCGHIYESQKANHASLEQVVYPFYVIDHVIPSVFPETPMPQSSTL